MGLKRSRSCTDRGGRNGDLKRIRRIASQSALGCESALFHSNPVGLSRQQERPENGQIQNNDDNSGSRDDYDVVDPKNVEPYLPDTSSVPISNWIEDLPKAPVEFDTMSQTTFKRPRSESDASLQLSDADSGNESRRSRGDLYKDPRYEALMESKGAYMRDSEAGPLPAEVQYCEELLYGDSAEADKVEWKDPVFDSDFLRRYVDLMQRSSELRLCIDLHARLVPSAEILSLQRGKIGDLREGCNDRWLQAHEFVPKIPQPDRTVAFRTSLFTDVERDKLGVRPGVKSLYAACEGMLFPFLTCEVKAGSEGLATAKRANANSMVVALRGVVDLFRRANMEQDVHRKILGVTISHNASTIEIYGHFPEIDGSKTAFYQYRLRAFDYADRGGVDRYTCCRFVHNIYTKFASRHLERLREAITNLDVPLALHDAILTPKGTDPGNMSAKSTASDGRGLTQKAQIALLTESVMNLQKEIERQSVDFKERELASKERELESKKREADLMKLLSGRSDMFQDQH